VSGNKDRPVGVAVDPRVVRKPEAVRLTGRYVIAEKLDTGKHGADLWAAVKGHDDLWDYMGQGPFHDEKDFRAFLDERAASTDPFAYAVIDRASGRAQGIVCLMETRPGARVIEIGNIVYSPSLQRTRNATEIQYLMARYVFDDLGYRRYEWKCNALNLPSRRAARRFGFTYEGTFRQHMIVKGRNRDTAWFAMLDNEWPGRRAAFERWLSPENFDAEGRQRESLSALNAVEAEERG
jgi:RimJ/RimL family protein N-acetyltransferase